MGDEQPEAGPATPVARTGVDYGVADREIRVFLQEYVTEDPMFSGDELHYEVTRGAVTVRGTVDSESELEALARRIRLIPGVERVDSKAVRVSTAGPR